MALDYAAYGVCNGKIDYISTVHTRTTAKNLVDYWKKNCSLDESFYCKQENVPEKYREQVKEYWIEYDASHKCPVEEYDIDALPW